MISALNLLPSSHNLTVSHVDRARVWRTSQITPMGGRVIFERLSCNDDDNDDDSITTTNAVPNVEKPVEQSVYVRINVNDGIVALPGCLNNGPGHSCPLGIFMDIVRKRGHDVGDFREACGLGADKPDHITFLHQ